MGWVRNKNCGGVGEMTRVDIKEYEKSITNQLLECLSIDAEFDYCGNEGIEADIVYKFEDNKLGIEVVTAYHDDYQAKIEWNLRRSKIKMPKGGIGLFKDVKKNPDEEMLKSLQDNINKKCEKSIQGRYNERAWLCVFENSPLSDDDTVKYFKNNLIIPKSKFERIYLLHLSPEGGGYKVWKLC